MATCCETASEIVITKEPEITVVVDETTISSLIGEGFQGPPGVAGPAGPSGPVILVVTAQSSIGGHRVVVLDALGNPEYADNTIVAHKNKVLGLTMNAGNIGDPVSVLRTGDITEPSWNWTLDQPVFLGANGLLTQTPPGSPAVFSQIIGFPISATRMYVALREPISLG